MGGVCFVDTETTGLDPDRHPIWEVALITPNGDEHVWQFAVEEINGVDPDDFDRHTALGDARWAKAIYEAVMGR